MWSQTYVTKYTSELCSGQDLFCFLLATKILFWPLSAHTNGECTNLDPWHPLIICICLNSLVFNLLIYENNKELLSTGIQIICSPPPFHFYSRYSLSKIVLDLSPFLQYSGYFLLGHSSNLVMFYSHLSSPLKCLA